jgi:tetratricopeptide (TPR) repeat protein
VFDQAKRNPLEPLWVGAALVLQTHAMVSGDSSGSIGLDKLRDAVIWQAGDYTLIRCWYLFTISREQGRGGPVKAVHIFDDAPKPVTAHPEAQLAIGAVEETGWMLVDDGRLEHSWGAALLHLRAFTPSLERAEAAYRAALSDAPDLHEARVRLGRVLTLEKRYDDALAVLADLPAGVEGGYRFLAALFEGDARERQADLDGAAAAYSRAIAIMPHAESATLALAHLRHAQGRRAEALERTRTLTATKDDVGTDPWLWYRLGTAWRTAAYLDAMQAFVRPR